MKAATLTAARLLCVAIIGLAMTGCAQFSPPRTCGPSGCPTSARPIAGVRPAFGVSDFTARNGQAPFDATCRVGVSDRDGATSWGSGTLVETFDDGTGLVVTNEHVVRDRRGDQAGQVVFRRGEHSTFRVLDADPIWDLAVLEVRAPEGLRPAKLAATAPRLGETVAVCGYGNQGFVQAATGVYLQNLAPRTGAPAEQLVVAPCSARQGDSGGPMFNLAGQVVGCQWGADGRSTVGSPCPHIQALLTRVRARLGRRRAPNSPSPSAAAASPPAAGQTLPQPPIDPEAANLRAHIRELERRLAEQAKQAAKPAIAAAAQEVGKRVEDQAIAAAPGWLAKLLPMAITALTGFGLPVAGTTGALWLAGKLAGFGLSALRARKLRRAKGSKLQVPTSTNEPGSWNLEPGTAAAAPAPLETASTIASADASSPQAAPPLSAAAPRTKIEYVRVPTIDPEGENYREMMRRMAQLTPALAPYFAQLESGKQNLMHGQQVSGRLSPAAIAAHDENAPESP